MLLSCDKNPDAFCLKSFLGSLSWLACLDGLAHRTAEA